MKHQRVNSTIRKITHASPLLVFWLSPDGKLFDAANAHHKNPPHGDRSVLGSSTHKGYLRGRAAIIDGVLHVVIYGDEKPGLSKKQLALLKNGQSAIFASIKEKCEITQAVLDSAKFINEAGDELPLTN